jgi:signal transduction histidine kinase
MIGALWTCVAAVALSGAVQWYGHPFAGVLLTPEGRVSSVGMPSWDGIAQGLQFPDQIESIDGVPLVASAGEFAATQWDREVDRAVARGQRAVHVQVRIAKSGDERDLDLKIERLDPATWWLYAGALLLVGALYALAAIIALSSRPDGVLAKTFAKFALAVALFSLTLFDVHTTRNLVPFFHAGFAGIPFGFMTLALRLPDDVPLVARHKWIPRAIEVAGVVFAGSIVVGDLTGSPKPVLQTLCTLLLGATLMLFVMILGIRYARSRGARRETMRVLFRATATPYVLVGLGMLISMLSARGSIAAFFAMPATALAPIATGIAFVRYDLWGSRALLSRVLTRSVATGIASILAVGIGAAFATSFGVPFRSALLAAAAGALISAPLVYLSTRTVERRFFPAVAEYKPTIEQLSEELTSITDPNEVGLAVERTVRRWLPCERVGFLITDADTARLSKAPRIVDGSEDPDEMSIPASFGGKTLGWLSVGRKRGGALFTTDDVDLLGTIANQAGLALAHAHSYAELERRRQQQAAAWQTERLALVETVAAEIAHEVRYPINFFRSVFQRDAANATLDAEEIDIGCEEVERLERLVSGLRRMVGHRIDRRVVQVSDLAARTEMLLRDALNGRELEVRVPSGAGLRCDSDQVTQVLVNLVANAIDAGGPRGRVGVVWSASDESAELVVWDDGPGFETDPSHLFSAWFTTKPRGTGLGLAITQRIVRAHGWVIDAVRVEGRTRFVVTIPSSDVIGNDELAPIDSDTIALEHAREST